jgi:hypothetical protein
MHGNVLIWLLEGRASSRPFVKCGHDTFDWLSAGSAWPSNLGHDPMHGEIDPGTVRGVLKQAGLAGTIRLSPRKPKR